MKHVCCAGQHGLNTALGQRLFKRTWRKTAE